MAQSRPTTTTDGAKALAHEFTGLKRRVRDLELRPDPAAAGGSSPVWATIYNSVSNWVPDRATIGGGDRWFPWWDTIQAESGGFSMGTLGSGTTAHKHAIGPPEAGLYAITVSIQGIVSWSGPADFFVPEMWIETQGFYELGNASMMSASGNFAMTQTFTVPIDTGEFFDIFILPRTFVLGVATDPVFSLYNGPFFNLLSIAKVGG